MTDMLLSVLQAGWTPLGLAALVVAFVLGGTVPVPRTIMVLVAGFIFGMAAVPIIMLSSTAGSLLAMLIGRSVARAPVRRWVARYPVASAVLRAVDGEGWRVVALLTFWSPVPITITNYAFAMTRIGLWTFALTTLVCGAPQTIAYCYLGSVGQLALQGQLPPAITFLPALIALACVAAAVLLIGRRVRAILREAALA